MKICPVGVELEIYSDIEKKWNRSGTVIASEDNSIKIKIDGRNEEICYSLEETVSLFLQGHVRRRNEGSSLSKDPNLIFYGDGYLSIEDYEKLGFHEDTPVDTAEELERKMKNSTSLRNAFFTTRENREKFKMVQVEGGELYYQIYKAFERDNLLENKLYKKFLADPVIVKMLNQAFLEEGIIGILPLLIGALENADINVFAEGTFPLFSKIMNYLGITTIKELMSWAKAMNKATSLSVLMILIDRCPFLLDAYIMKSIKKHKNNEKIKELLRVISEKIAYWNRTVMPEAFRVIKDFLKDGSKSVVFNFESEEFPKHFTGFEEMIDTIDVEFQTQLKMKVNHVCVQRGYRINGFPKKIYDGFSKGMKDFRTFCQKFDANSPDIELIDLLHEAGVRGRVNDSLEKTIYTIKCSKANEEQQEPVQTTVGEHLEKVYHEVYRNAPPDDPEKEIRMKTLERGLISCMYHRKPHRGYAIGTTAATCKEVLVYTPSSRLIYVMKCDNDNEEQQEPEQKTMGEHLEKVYQEVYRNAPPDDPEKESRMLSLERGLLSEMSHGRPHRGYAIGTTAATCMEVFKANPNYKAFSPRSRLSPIYVMKYSDDNEEQQEPVPTTIGEHLEKLYDEVYENAPPDDPEKESRMLALERNLLKNMYRRIPHRGYAIGTTAAACKEVVVYTPSARVIYVMKCVDDNEEQQKPEPVQTTIGEHLEKVYDEVYGTAAPDDPEKEIRMKTLERYLLENMYQRKLHRGYAIGTTAATCKEVVVYTPSSSPIYTIKCGDDNEEQQEPVQTTIGEHLEKVYDEVYENAPPDDQEKESRMLALERGLRQKMYRRIPHRGYAIGTTAATCMEVFKANTDTESENSSLITDINENDVLCGRGGAVNSNQGNISFQKLVKEKNDAYQSAETSEEKARIVNEIKDTIQKKTPSGRFLKKSENSDGHIAIDDEKIKKKIQAAFRDVEKKDKNKKDKNKKEKTKKEKTKASVKQRKRSTSAMQADQPGGTEEKKKKKTTK